MFNKIEPHNPNMYDYARKECEPAAVACLTRANGYHMARQLPPDFDAKHHADISAFELPGGLNDDVIAHLVNIDVKTVDDKNLKTGNISIPVSCVEFWMAQSQISGALHSYRVMFQVIENGKRTNRFRIVKTIDLLGYLTSECSLKGDYWLASITDLFKNCKYVEIEFDV